MSRPTVTGLTVALAALLFMVAACADQPHADPSIDSRASSTDGICARLPEIREALLDALDEVVDCAQVTDDHLASIDGTLNLSGLDIEAIDPGDLNGLVGLRGIDLSSNGLRHLTDQLFAGLPSLCHVDVQHNPGAPFVYTMRLLEIQTDDLRHIAIDWEPAPPLAVNALLRNEHIALSQAVVRTSAGERRSTLAQLGGVFGAEQGQIWIADAAFAPAADCGRRFVHLGLELSVDPGELVVDAWQSIPEADESRAGQAGCAGIPTQVIVVEPQSFDNDERLLRLVTSRSGACFTAVTIAPEPGRNPGGRCTLTEYVETISRGTSQTSDADGDCGWLEIEHSAGQGGRATIDGCAAESLRLQVGAATFNRTGRVDLVRYDAESRCYAFLSAARDPHRAEPFRFSADQTCVIGSGVPPSTGCRSILVWSGIGRGGVDSERDTRAEVARIRPARAGEADAGRAGLIEACLELPALWIRLDADALDERAAWHDFSTDPDQRCFLALVVAPDPRAGGAPNIAAGRHCLISTSFQLLGFLYQVPTTREGDCGGLIHLAWYLPADGQLSTDEFAATVAEAAAAMAGSSAERWSPAPAGLICVNDVCVIEWVSTDHDADP